MGKQSVIQNDRQMERQGEKWVDGETGGWVGTRTDRQADGKTHTVIQTNRYTDRQVDVKTDRQADGHAER